MGGGGGDERTLRTTAHLVRLLGRGELGGILNVNIRVTAIRIVSNKYGNEGVLWYLKSCR